MHDEIIISGARQHNLKNIDLKIPKNKLVVITGLSGSGKSTLAFDTIYAEGQRRYVESLSAYARQFLELMDKPDVDSIDGLSPAISIQQKTTSKNPRSTVGTVTEIYDYLRLLYSRIGIPHCPQCNLKITSQSVDSITDSILKYAQQKKTLILAPIIRAKKGTYEKLFDELKQSGFARIRLDSQIINLEDDELAEEDEDNERTRLLKQNPRLDRQKKHTI
jgi:excinuclease ABC subunit A